MDNLNIGKDDEYHFSENENPDVFGVEAVAPPEQKNIFDRLKRKNVLVAVGVIIAVLIAYKLMGFFLHSEHNKTQGVISSSAVKPASEPTQAQVPANPSAMNPNMVTALDSTNSEIKNRLDQIQAQAAAMQNALINLAGKVDFLSNSLQNLSNEVIQQQARLTAMQETKKKTKLSAKPAIARPVYYVQAMIPGRAWLKSASGETITISSGDQLPGYGMVEAIDPDQGIVMTSSRIVIRYHPNDS